MLLNHIESKCHLSKFYLLFGHEVQPLGRVKGECAVRILEWWDAAEVEVLLQWLCGVPVLVGCLAHHLTQRFTLTQF